MEMSRWQGKVALVTGASGGIGYAIAQRLVEAGMRVAACARSEDKLAELAKTAGDTLLPLRCDLRETAQITTMFDAIRERWDGVDVLVNNAGLGHDAPLLSGSEQHWREMLDVNVLALCVATREAVTDMQRRETEGHVIHVSSMAGHRVPRGAAFTPRRSTPSKRSPRRFAWSYTRPSCRSASHP